jgi:hypothetical protein
MFRIIKKNINEGIAMSKKNLIFLITLVLSLIFLSIIPLYFSSKNQIITNFSSKTTFSNSSIFQEISKTKKILNFLKMLEELEKNKNSDTLITNLPEEDKERLQMRELAYQKYEKNKKQQLVGDEKLEYENLLKILGDRKNYRPYKVLDLSKKIMDRIDAKNLPEELYDFNAENFKEFAKKIIQSQLIKLVISGDVSNQQEYYSVFETCVSRLCMQKMDRDLAKTGTKKKIGYLIPLWNEQERLQKPSEILTGEDFLNVKAEQLDFLYSGIQNVDYEITIMFDRKYAKDDAKQKVLDMIPLLDTIRKKLPINMQAKINLLSTFDEGFEDLRKGLNLSASRKGGAVHVGIRYFLKKRPDITHAYYTDADISVNPGNTGILLFENFYNKKTVVIGSRTMPESHVFRKSWIRKFLSIGFNEMTRLLFLLDISDTQVGAKLIELDLKKLNIYEQCTEVTMSFDPQLLKFLEVDGASILEVGIVWIDSALLSQSAGLAKRMFVDSTRMWNEMFPTWGEYFKTFGLNVVAGMVKNLIPNVWPFVSLEKFDMNFLKIQLYSKIPTNA